MDLKSESSNSENILREDRQLQQFQTQLPTCDVAIDIGQILAANQTLLKNMARRMEYMENKIQIIEGGFSKQSEFFKNQYNAILLLNAPVKEIKPWEPESKEKLDDGYFGKFSMYDKFFRPWKMRRKNN